MVHAEHLEDILHPGVNGNLGWDLDHVWSEIDPLLLVLIDDMVKDVLRTELVRVNVLVEFIPGENLVLGSIGESIVCIIV